MSATSPGTRQRTRADRCPGVLRPWPAADGGLVRIRIPGGRVATSRLVRLAEVARRHGDGRVHVTGRANLQLRGFPMTDGRLPRPALAAIEETGLLPSRSHDLARNVLCSPQTGRAGGRADLRLVVRALDRAICASAALAALPGRFLFTLDDGRLDVVDRQRDLGLVALDHRSARLLVGRAEGGVLPLADAPAALVELAERFVAARGTGPGAAWHVDELSRPLVGGLAPAALGASSTAEGPALPYGRVDGGEHVPVGDDGISLDDAAAWASRTSEVVVTPWHGVLV